LLVGFTHRQFVAFSESVHVLTNTLAQWLLHPSRVKQAAIKCVLTLREFF